MKAKKQNFNSTHKAKPLKKREERFFVKDAVGAPILLRKKLTIFTSDAAVTGNQLVYAIDTSGVSSATEWANESANWQDFRVRAIKVRLVPVQRDNMNSAALIWYPGSIISGSYPSGSSASTPAALFSEDGSRVHPEWLIAEHMVTWESNPNAKLWSNCNLGAPDALNRFGLQFRGTQNAPLAYNGLVTHDVYVEFDVEFRGRN